MKIRNTMPALTVLIAFLLTGCRTVPYVPGVAIQDDARAQSLREGLHDKFPQQFRAVHRAVLTVRHRQFNLEGYLRGDHSKGYRFVVTTGFGSSMFSLVWLEDTGLAVLSNNGFMTNAQLIAGPGEDLLSTYFRRPSESARLTECGTEYWALTDTLSDGTLEEFLFDKQTGNLVRYLRSANGRTYYVVEFKSWDAHNSDSTALPRQIHVENMRHGYEVDIQVIDFQADTFDFNSIVKIPAHDS